MNRQRIALLGSTGSIGVQTLDIVRENSSLFEITTLTAHRNWQILAQQAVEFMPDSVVIADERYYADLKNALAQYPIKVYAGDAAVAQVAADDNVDVVVNALVGYAGLMPTVAAVKKSKKVALANKETLVVAGSVVMKLAEQYRAPIIPIDAATSDSKNSDARAYVMNMPSCAAAPNIISLGFANTGLKSIIAPIPINSISGKSSFAIPALNRVERGPLASARTPSTYSPTAPENGRFTSIVPNPKGSKSVGSISFLIARNISSPPIAHITR